VRLRLLVSIFLDGPLMLSSSQGLGVPVLVGTNGGLPPERVTVCDLNGSTYGEAWLQRLIDSDPAGLPIDEIEPGLPDFLSLCGGIRGRGSPVPWIPVLDDLPP
jgi:hypothetical protein